LAKPIACGQPNPVLGKLAKPDLSSPNQRNRLFSGQMLAETGILWWKKVSETAQSAGFFSI
jgi:hypothetical protein